MDKIGYFRLLPRDLIKEMYKYFEKYFDTSFETYLGQYLVTDYTTSYLFTEYVKTMDKDSRKYLDNYYIEIRLKFCDTNDEGMAVPFLIQLPTLKKFLKVILKSHTFIFINGRDLKLQRASSMSHINVKDEDLQSAKRGILTNLLSNFGLDVHYLTTVHFIEFMHPFENGGFVSLYLFNSLKSEVLIYKLIKFYNDAVNKKLKDWY